MKIRNMNVGEVVVVETPLPLGYQLVVCHSIEKAIEVASTKNDRIFYLSERAAASPVELCMVVGELREKGEFAKFDLQ